MVFHTHRLISIHRVCITHAELNGCAVEVVSLRPLTCWDCGLESRREHGCLSLVSVVCCQLDVCVGLITHPEEYYRGCVCVIEYDKGQQ